MSERTLREAVSAWIREDAGTAVKLSITPAQVNALVSRILDAHTAEQPAVDANETPFGEHQRGLSVTDERQMPVSDRPGPDAGAKRPLPRIRFGVHSRPINPNDDR